MIDSLVPERRRRRTVAVTVEQAVHRFYVLLSGRVKVTRHHPGNGREVTLFLLGPGDGYDVVSFLDGCPHRVVAETLDPVELLSGPAELWRDWLETYPDFRKAFRKYVDRQMRELAELAGDLALHDTMTRLTHLILRYFDHPSGNPVMRPNLIKDLSHEELAHMIGTVRVVVNRLLAELRREGIVDTHGGELRVRDLERLLHKVERKVNGA